MKLYCTTYYDDAPDLGHEVVGHCSTWQGTQAHQNQVAKALKTNGMRDIVKHVEDVPTSKADLLAWLNRQGVFPTP